MPTLQERSQKPSKRRRTFAPPSRYEDATQWVKPGRGDTVEVLLAWGGRVLSARHFASGVSVTAGTDDACDVALPFTPGLARSWALLERKSGTTRVSLLAGTRAEILDSAGARRTLVSTGAIVDLGQGELLKIELSADVFLLVRHVAVSRRVRAQPLAIADSAEFWAGFIALLSTFWLMSFRFERFAAKPDAPEPAATPPSAKILVQHRTEAKATPTPAPLVVPVQNTTEAPKRQAVARPQSAGTGAKAPGRKKPATLKPGPTAGPAAAPRSTTPLLALDGLSDPARDSKSLFEAATRAQGAATSQSKNSSEGEARNRLRDTTSGREGEAARAIGDQARSDFKGDGRHKTDGSGSFGLRRGEVSLPSGPGEGVVSDGSVSREAIRRVILANLGAIRACYQSALRTNPRIEGKVTLHWEVAARGDVTSSHFQADTPEMRAVGECVRLRLRAWKFPEPPQGSRYTVDYPFRFSIMD